MESIFSVIYLMISGEVIPVLQADSPNITDPVMEDDSEELTASPIALLLLAVSKTIQRRLIA